MAGLAGFLCDFMHSSRNTDGGNPHRPASIDKIGHYFDHQKAYVPGDFWPMMVSYLIDNTSLTTNQISSYLLYDILGFSLGDVGLLLNVNKGTVQRRVQRVRTALLKINTSGLKERLESTPVRT